jgi:serine/threonine protein phosphatase PrpC
MVADGVGGGMGGEEASRIAVETVTRYVAESVRCYYSTDADEEHGLLETLQAAALRCHEAVVQQPRMPIGGMATLTLWLGLRRHLTTGSRCYPLPQQLTRLPGPD